MSKHWDPRPARRAAQDWPGNRARAGHRRRPSRRRKSPVGPAIAFLLTFGCFMYAAAPGGFIDAAGLGETATSAFSSDPFAESGRSREIFDAQEGPLPDAGDASYAGRKGASYAATGRVHVVDGDTFRIGGDIVRIADIDTPEMRGRCPSESALARRAKMRLASLIQGESVSLTPSGDGRDEDQYGRKLRIVSVGGSNVGDQLIAEGLARPWVGRRMPWCA